LRIVAFDNSSPRGTVRALIFCFFWIKPKEGVMGVSQQLGRWFFPEIKPYPINWIPARAGMTKVANAIWV